MTKRVAVIQDLSGLGRCSMTAAIAVLSALGVQACPLPTAVLSAQTGFPGYVLRDLAADLVSFPAHWKQLGLELQGVYSGFLASAGQVERVLQVLDDFAGPGSLVLVDPVLGDGGAPYPFCTPGLIQEMGRLAARADILTPNLTEAALLTGTAYHKTDGVESAKILGQALRDRGAKNVVITGVPEGDSLCNLVCTAGGQLLLRRPRHPGSFSGTGDLFAAVLCGAALRGAPLEKAAELAADFLSAALASTPAGADPRYGVAFEENLYLLTEASQTWKRKGP